LARNGEKIVGSGIIVQFFDLLSKAIVFCLGGSPVVEGLLEFGNVVFEGESTLLESFEIVIGNTHGIFGGKLSRQYRRTAFMSLKGKQKVK
jgi:hypothetical protein